MMLESISQLGQELTLDGCITTDWTRILLNEYKGQQHKVNIMMMQLIKRLWKISWDMWDHRNQKLHEKGENET